MIKRERIRNYLYIVPVSALVLAFIYYPILYNIRYSFYSWDGLSPQKKWIGFENYIRMLSDNVFFIALKNIFIFSALTISIGMIIGLILALTLLKNGIFEKLHKTVLFLPVVVAPIVVANIFSWIYEMNTGLLNTVLRMIGLGFLANPWLGDSDTALFAITAAQIWQSIGWYMIMYTASLTVISTHIFEAAKIDGANWFQLFFKIIVPMLKNTHYSLIILGTIGSLKYFELIWATTKGGPNHATEFFSTYIFRNSFDFFKQGYASALSVVMLLIAFLVTAIQLKLSMREG